MAVAEPRAAPGRTPARPPLRAPAASPSASSKMDLPAPVSPVRTFRPGANSSAACSIRTMSRMVSAASTGLDSSEDAADSLTDPGALVFLRLQVAPLQNVIGVLVPARAGIIAPQHGGRGLGFPVQPQAVIG